MSVEYEIAAADEGYIPIPSFSEWRSSKVDEIQWNRYKDELNEKRSVKPNQLDRSLRIVRRMAALETGAIEGLYSVDRGFTFTVAQEMATWEASVQAKGNEAENLITSQLNAYDFVLDFATRDVPIAEAWIRTLQSEICQGQDGYKVQTPSGMQKQPLPLGVYKTMPNHVRTPKNTIHSYAPVLSTASEMNRLCQELGGSEFEKAHPILQSSYAHYCLVAIHPFADGNGRVARALASVFTYRSCSVPLLVFSENRVEYFSTLAMADDRNYQPFVDFILDRILDAIMLVSQTMQAATLPSLDERVINLKRIFTTRAGHSHQEVDRAGMELLKIFDNEVKEAARRVNIPELFEVKAEETIIGSDFKRPGYRMPKVSNYNSITLSLHTYGTARKEITRRFTVLVPVDGGPNDPFLVHETTGETKFTVRGDEMFPTPKPSIAVRMKIWVEQLLSEETQNIIRLARDELRKVGYLHE